MDIAEYALGQSDCNILESTNENTPAPIRFQDS